jgi:hypothetical protein
MATRRYANIQRSATIPDPAIILSKILFVIGPISRVSYVCLDIDVTCMDKILSAIMFELNVLEITRLSFPIQVRALNFLIAKRVPDFFKSALSSRN